MLLLVSSRSENFANPCHAVTGQTDQLAIVASFNAVLRDYARLGRLLAHDGAWDGKQIVPARRMIGATTVRASDGYLLPGAATKRFGYSYLLWLFPGERRQFALLGYKGQYICVDPTSKVVMVHTAIEDPAHRDEPWALWSALVDQLG